MLFSVITINLNNKVGLEKTIESVRSSEKKLYEYIVIDGGSSDGSLEVIDGNSSIIDHYICEKDTGIFNAMNKGIDLAEGEYCIFLNSGDVLIKGALAVLATKIDKNTDIFYCDSYMVFPEKKEAWIAPEVVTAMFLYQTAINHQATAIKTYRLKADKYNEQFKIVSDWYWFFKQLINGLVFKKVEIYMVEYDMTGISVRNKERNDLERQIALRKILPDCVIRDYERICQEDDSSLNIIKTIKSNHPRVYSGMVLIAKILRKLDRILVTR